MNALMLLTVAGALIVSLLRGSGDATAGWDPREALTDAAAPAPTETPSPGDAYRAQRRETRNREQAALQSLLNSEYAAAETRALAAETLASMARNDEIELAVEAVLSARGYADAVCVARQGEVTILLSVSLSGQEAALILEIARVTSGLSPENIRVTGF